MNLWAVKALAVNALAVDEVVSELIGSTILAVKVVGSKCIGSKTVGPCYRRRRWLVILVINARFMHKANFTDLFPIWIALEAMSR